MKSIFKDATGRLLRDDGLIYSSAMAFSAILALFPFLIFVTTLAGFLGGPEAAKAAVNELFVVLPAEIAGGLNPAIEGVLSVKRTGLLTFSIVATIIISSNAVDILRKSLNRAYRVQENRPRLFCLAQNLLYVIGGAAGFIILGFAIILAPSMWNQFVKIFPDIAEYKEIFTLSRYALASFVLFMVLTVTHLYLPAAKRRMRDIFPGICLTLILWLSAATAFSVYLSRVNMYIALYASLAGLMIAMVFFFMSAVIFVYGAELNRAILEKDTQEPS